MDEERFIAIREDLKRLTPRQERIVRERCATGKSVMGMVESLGISEGTINSELKTIYGKLRLDNGIKDLDELVCEVLRRLDEPEPPVPKEPETPPAVPEQVVVSWEDLSPRPEATPVVGGPVIAEIFEDSPPIQEIPVGPLFSPLPQVEPINPPGRRFLLWVLAAIAVVIASTIFVLNMDGDQRENATPTATEEIAAFVASSTPTLSPTPGPSPTPTVTLEPTATWTPEPTVTPSTTPTPIPTIDPLGLKIGDEFADGRVTIEMTDYRFGNYFRNDWYGLIFMMEFNNHSGEEILLNFEANDFQVTDNLGRLYTCEFVMLSLQKVIANLPMLSEVNIPMVNDEVATFELQCSDHVFLDDQVTNIALNLTGGKLSTLPQLTWHIDVPR
jgi:hypothetical protein